MTKKRKVGRPKKKVKPKKTGVTTPTIIQDDKKLKSHENIYIHVRKRTLWITLLYAVALPVLSYLFASRIGFVLFFGKLDSWIGEFYWWSIGFMITEILGCILLGVIVLLVIIFTPEFVDEFILKTEEKE